MKKLILIIACALSLSSHAQNYLLQNKQYIVNQLIQEHARFRTGYNSHGAQYIDVDETQQNIVSHKAYFLNSNEICIEYDIITEDIYFFQELLNVLNTAPTYTQVSTYEWNNYDFSAHITARSDYAHDNTPIYVIKYTLNRN